MAFFAGAVNLLSPGPIGSTTPNTGAFTTLDASNGTLTSSTPAFTLSQTWNSAGVTFTALRANVTDTASASGSLLMDLQVGGSSRATINKSGQISANVGQLSSGFGFAFLGGTNGIYSPSSSGSWYFASTGNAVAEVRSSGLGLGSLSLSWGSIGSTQDVILTRDAAAILAQRNSTNAQTFRIYNTYTDASNYERGFMQWSSNVLSIGAEAAGTGTSRVLRLSSSVDEGIEFFLGTRVMSVKQSGGFTQIYYTSNPWLISASVAGSGNTNFTAQPLQFNAGRGTGSGANGYIQFRASPSTSSGTAQHPFLEEAFRISVPSTGAPFCSFGGTSSSFPALKRSSAVLQARLADDSGFAQVQGKLTTDTNYTVTAPSATGYLTIYDASGTAYKVLCST
jgi:hypothetical protein